jgi:hypothetical protein
LRILSTETAKVVGAKTVVLDADESLLSMLDQTVSGALNGSKKKSKQNVKKYSNEFVEVQFLSIKSSDEYLEITASVRNTTPDSLEFHLIRQPQVIGTGGTNCMIETGSEGPLYVNGGNFLQKHHATLVSSGGTVTVVIARIRCKDGLPTPDEKLEFNAMAIGTDGRREFKFPIQLSGMVLG